LLNSLKIIACVNTPQSQESVYGPNIIFSESGLNYDCKYSKLHITLQRVWSSNRRPLAKTTFNNFIKILNLLFSPSFHVNPFSKVFSKLGKMNGSPPSKTCWKGKKLRKFLFGKILGKGCRRGFTLQRDDLHFQDNIRHVQHFRRKN